MPIRDWEVGESAGGTDMSGAGPHPVIFTRHNKQACTLACSRGLCGICMGLRTIRKYLLSAHFVSRIARKRINTGLTLHWQSSSQWDHGLFSWTMGWRIFCPDEWAYCGVFNTSGPHGCYHFILKPHMADLAPQVVASILDLLSLLFAENRLQGRLVVTPFTGSVVIHPWPLMIWQTLSSPCPKVMVTSCFSSFWWQGREGALPGTTWVPFLSCFISSIRHVHPLPNWARRNALSKPHCTSQ